MSTRGNISTLEAEAASVTGRYLDGATTIQALMREYHVGYPTLVKFLRGHTTAEQMAAVRHRNVVRGGAASRFQPGNVPWTKGRKGIHLSPATEFKPGCIRGKAARLYRHIGSVTIRRAHRGRRYRWIKVRDDGPAQYRCIPYARYVWQQTHGDVPPGGCIVHIDGNTLNDAPGNLQLILRRLLPKMARLLDPEFDAKRIASLRKTRRRRAKNNGVARRLQELRGPTVTVWHCGGCGHTTEGDKPDLCPKCVTGRLQQIERRVRA